MQLPSEQAQVEKRLVAYLESLRRGLSGWRAIHLQLSQLQPQNRLHFKLQMAASEFSKLLQRFKGELFQLHNGDLFYFWQGESVAEVRQIVLGISLLFSDDPLMKAGVGEGDLANNTGFDTVDDGLATQPRFCSSFELERDCDALVLRVRQSVGEASVKPRKPLDPADLARIESRLAGMSLSGILRWQPICAVLPGAAPRPLCTEVHVAIRQLSDVFEIDLIADPWLFQRLGESLDRRLMSSLANGVKGAEGPISINLRLPTLFSPEFLKFDETFSKNRSDSIVIELQLIDIFAELGGFLFIQKFLRDRGYLVCIDGLHHLHLPLIDRERLGAHIVKVIWSPDLLDAVNEGQLAEFKAAINRTGVDQVVLCRCDSAEAVSWGQAVGIELFQGHYVDSLLRLARPPAIAAARSALRNAAR
jgi:hypothetical protein